MSKKKIMVDIAVENATKETSIDVEDMKDWEPKKITPQGGTVYFEVDGTFYNMNADDFNEYLAPKK